jgi:BirA family transcriptional regulator, biotin operon repressor / biotin---[acetyl-CoA-carboxylase] ligase
VIAPEVTPDLLSLLEPGIWQSGETLAGLMKVSRTSVWKAVQNLKGRGYPLEAGKAGYRLEADAPVGLPLVTYLGRVGSTMDEARLLARGGAAEFSVVLAEQQTAGRGRRGRVWESPVGAGLYFSLILRPRVPLSYLSLLPLLAGACLQRAISAETRITTFLKWSNDVLAADGRKLAGVLLEAEIEDGQARFVCIGMGVNVRHQDFPAAMTACALEDFVEMPIHRRRLLQRVLEELELQYERFLATPKIALQLWREVNGTLGRRVRILEPSGDSWEGVALEVTADGALMVETERGVKTVFAGDVSLRYLETI